MALTGKRWLNRRQKRLLMVASVLFALLLWLSPTLRYYTFSLFEYPIHYKEYKHFDIRIPGNYKIHGIDVSKWQSRIDWQRVKAMKVGDIRFSFAFMKATEGSWQSDKQYGSNWENAKKNGLIRGAYHFYLPQVNPKLQAVNFMRVVQLRSGDLPPVVDVEESNGMSAAQIRKGTKTFMDILERHYGVKPILYTNRDFYKRYFADEPDFKPYILWIAHYNVNELSLPDNANWHFWQHSDEGRVNGINEKVDFNVFYGDSADLRRICVP
jgi:lysozyme